jgi:hypothetical protein
LGKAPPLTQGCPSRATAHCGNRNDRLQLAVSVATHGVESQPEQPPVMSKRPTQRQVDSIVVCENEFYRCVTSELKCKHEKLRSAMRF